MMLNLRASLRLKAALVPMKLALHFGENDLGALVSMCTPADSTSGQEYTRFLHHASIASSILLIIHTEAVSLTAFHAVDFNCLGNRKE